MADETSSESKTQDPITASTEEPSGEPVKTPPAERRVIIKRLIEEKGLHALNKLELGRRFGISDQQITRDVEEIMGDLPPVDWGKLFNKTLLDIDRSLDIANKALDKATDERIRGRLANQISEILLKKTTILEKMEKLLPASAKAEPVTITYRCVEPIKEKKDLEPPMEEPVVDLSGVPASG